MSIIGLHTLAKHNINLYDNKLMLLSDMQKLKNAFTSKNSMIDALILSLVTNYLLHRTCQYGRYQLDIPQYDAAT